MHRHGYKNSKLGRTKDPRRLLIKGLATDLIQHTTLRTTLTKAKTVMPYVERLITKAKKGGLHNRRQIISKLATKASAHQLVDQIAPQLNNRQSGYLRLQKLGARRGDNAPMASIAFVDKLSEPNADNDAKTRPDVQTVAKVKKPAKAQAVK